MAKSNFFKKHAEQHVRNLQPHEHTEYSGAFLKELQAADALKTIEELLNIYSCPTFSPNIEVRCMRRLQQEAQRRLEDEIRKIEVASISEETRAAFSQSLRQSWQEVTSKILGANIQNDHSRDSNKVIMENNIQLNLANTARVITQQKANLEVAILDKIKKKAVIEKTTAEKKEAEEVTLLLARHVEAARLEMISGEAKKKDEETQATVQKQAELERIMAERVEEERLAMERKQICGFDKYEDHGVFPEGQQTEEDLAIAGNINPDKAEHF